MYREPPIDDRYRRALGAAREVAELGRMLDELDAEIRDEQARADRARELLAGERSEVARFEHGVWAFLYGVIADRHARLSSAQETAAVLEVTLHEATAAIEELGRQRGVLAARRDAIVPIANGLTEVRAERVAELADTPVGDEVLALVVRLAELDDEPRAIRHAIAAGEAAEDSLIAITTADAFRTGQHVNQAPGQHDYVREVTWLLLNLEKHAGRTNAQLAVFRRALASLGLQCTAELPSPEVQSVFLTRARAQSEYAAVWAQVLGVVQAVGARLTELRARGARVAASIATLEAERDRLLQPG